MAKQDKFERTEEEQKRSEEIHDKFREELLKRQLSNNEGYDKAILSLSSAGLALSLTAIKFVVPLETASYLWALKMSWVLFLLTVLSTLAAYLIGNKAIDKQLEIAEDYYLKALVSAQTAKNPTSIHTHTTHSADIPRMQSAPSRSSATASADIPTMQMAPGTQSKSSGQSSAGNGDSGTSKSSDGK